MCRSAGPGAFATGLKIALTAGIKASGSRTEAASYDLPLLGSIQYVSQCLSNLDFDAGYGPCETYHQNATNSTNFYYCIDDGACGECCECVSECDPTSKPPYASSSHGHINGSFNSITIIGENFGYHIASSRVKIGGSYSPTVKWTSGMMSGELSVLCAGEQLFFFCVLYACHLPKRSCTTL